MKFYTSYFYAIRFFTPNMIPLSTAVWDPRWFHEFLDNDHIFKDGNGVYNGLRIEQLNPKSCHAGGCPCESKGNYLGCNFLKSYREGLSRIDFNKLMEDITELANYISTSDNILIDDIKIVLIVHEAPDNPCSERLAIQELFKSNGINISEWEY